MEANIPNIVVPRGLRKDDEEKASKSTSVLPIRPFHLPISTSSSPGCQTPCLLFSINTINKIFHPLNNKCCDMDFKFEAGTQVYAAKDDWLLLYDICHDIFFFNLFTKTKIEIPALPHLNPRSMCFTSLPTSTDWQIVVGVFKHRHMTPIGRIENHRTIICTINCGDDNWSSIEYDIDFKFSFCSSVIHKGFSYFLDMNANVLIYNHQKRIAHTYMASKCINKKIYAGDAQQYLLENNDEKLMAVFVSADGSCVQTCEWDDHKKTWEIVRSLGNKMLFVSRPSSLCEEASVQGPRNAIYFPRFIDDCCLCYSLSTKAYYTLASGSPYKSFHKSKLPLGGTATWIRPLLMSF